MSSFKQHMATHELILSFLFTLEEFGREALFLLDTVEEVSTSCSSDIDTSDHLRSRGIDIGLPQAVDHVRQP